MPAGEKVRLVKLLHAQEKDEQAGVTLLTEFAALHVLAFVLYWHSPDMPAVIPIT